MKKKYAIYALAVLASVGIILMGISLFLVASKSVSLFSGQKITAYGMFLFGVCWGSANLWIMKNDTRYTGWRLKLLESWYKLDIALGLLILIYSFFL